jgi:hypothetical protein
MIPSRPAMRTAIHDAGGEKHVRIRCPASRAWRAPADPGAGRRRRRHAYTFGIGETSPTGRIRTWRGFTPFGGPTMPSRSIRSTIFAALL